MKPGDFSSMAEYYRAHREVFALALELGVTPADAEPEWRRRKHEERLAEIREARRRERKAIVGRRLAANPPPPIPTTHPRPAPDFRDWGARHMMRD